MSARDEINKIRVVRVTKQGKDVGFSALGDKLKNVSPDGFVALDAEFSGLGTHPDLKHENLETRYAALRQIADTRALFSVGVAIFDKLNSDVTMADPTTQSSEISEEDTLKKPSMKYEVANFDLLLSCQSEFSLNANAGEFLTSHSFDFNEMFQKGIPYERASTEKPPEKEGEQGLPWQWGKMPRGLLWRIGRQAVPVVVHNGLFDLVFLFAAFQGPLPKTLHGFACALLECVPAGFYDTKVLASTASERASFLAYLFAKSVFTEKVSVVTGCRLPSNDLTDPREEVVVADETLCALYAFRGFCPRGTRCPFQHDPFMAVAEENDGKSPKDNKDAYKRHKLQTKLLKRRIAEKKQGLAKMSKKQRKKLLIAQHEEVTVTADTEKKANCEGSQMEEARDSPGSKNKHEVDTIVVNRLNNIHSAGWDAFCTGYAFAAYRTCLSSEKLIKDRNRIALPYKVTSLFLCKSQFADLDKTTSSTKETSKEPTSPEPCKQEANGV